jgi:hypothetical protein
MCALLLFSFESFWTLSLGERWRIVVVLSGGRTGTAEDAGDLDELDGDLCGFHFDVLCDELG